MAVSRRAVLLLFVLLVAAEIGTIDANMGVSKQILSKDKAEEEEEEKSKEEEESLCSSKSLKFKGFCFDSDKCKEACSKESFPDGKCKLDGIKRKCFCKQPC